MRIWTDEERVAQSELIRRVRPWLKSTGPKIKAGKRKVSKNARKPASFEAWSYA
jgi:hypothetical protein